MEFRKTQVDFVTELKTNWRELEFSVCGVNCNFYKNLYNLKINDDEHIQINTHRIPTPLAWYLPNKLALELS